MQTISLQNSRLFYLAIGLSVAPLWLVEYLPMVDLPQHAAQVAALRELLAGNPIFLQEFEINWFTPYLLAYFLLFAISTVFSLPIATKILVTAAVAAVPILSGVLLREVGADERLRWLTIPGAISFAFYWGFLSFMCAVPVGLVLILSAIRFQRNPTIRQALTIGALSILLFFSHVLVLGVASLACLIYILAGHYRRPWTVVRLWLPFTAALPLVFAWAVTTYQGEAYVQDAPVVYGSFVQRLVQLVAQPTGIDFLSPLPILAVALVLILSPVFLGCALTRDIKRWMLFVTALGVFFLFPTYAFRTAFLYERFGIFLLPLWVLLWDRPAVTSTKADWVPIVTITLIASFNVMRFSAFNVETRHFSEVIAAIENGSRVASVVHKHSSIHFQHYVYLHQGAWYQSIGKGIVDFNFGFFYPQLVRFKEGRQTGVNEQFAWRPFDFTWEQYDGDVYDYFLFHADQDLGSYLFREHTSSVPLVAHSGEWWLYRNNRGTDPQ